MRRALKTSIFVGLVLVLINHGDALFSGQLGAARLAKILLTFLVPYLVSTFASVAAIREAENQVK